MAQVGKLIDIQIAPGTNPTPDATKSDTLHWTATQLVRFFNGKLRKFGGWLAVTFSNTQTIRGAARTIFSYRSGSKDKVLIGTNTRLYVHQDGSLYNITPFLSSTTTIANSLSTNYKTLGVNPLGFVTGSQTITVTDTATKVRAGDSITISGVPGAFLRGIPTGEINTTHLVRSSSANSFTIRTATSPATADPPGGGAAVVLATPIITVNAPTHGLVDGDRVEIAGATDIGGILAAAINLEWIIRNTTTNTFDIATATIASSSVTGGGGASTTYRKPISKGAINTNLGFGYGGGLYGMGLYGVGKAFVNAFTYPRIWSAALFGTTPVMTPGNGGKVYIWSNSTNTAPTILTNAPDADYVFVTNNSVGVLKGNTIARSSVGDATLWDPTDKSGSAYAETIWGASDFISEAPLKDYAVIFTENTVYTHEFVDFPDLYKTLPVYQADGLIAPHARAIIENAVLWMGQDDFYIYDGNSIVRIEWNTCRQYVYQNLNYSQRWKIVASTVEKFSEVSWDIPMFESFEPNYRLTLNYVEKHATISPLPGTAARTAAEEFSHISQNPYMAYSISESTDGVLYRHETGVDDNLSAMDCYAVSNYVQIGNGDTQMIVSKIVPDSTQTGDIDFSVYTQRYPQSSITDVAGPYTINSSTQKIDLRAIGRLRAYRVGQNALGEDMIMGKWFEQLQEGTPL